MGLLPRLFSCKVCQEKDKRIADLTEQLKTQVELTKYIVSPHYSQAVTQQANIALTGASSDVAVSETKEMTAVEKQALQMITGDY